MKLSRRFHSDHLLILQGASWVVLFLFLGKLVSAAKEMAIAYQYGVSGVVDAYQVAFTTVTWLPTTLVSALSVVLVPLFVRVRLESDEEGAVFVQEVQGVSLAFGVLLVLVTVLAGGFYVNRVAINLPYQTRTLAVHLTHWLAPMAALTLMLGVLSARLQSYGKQLNTLLECIPALIIMVCVLLPLFAATSNALLWGTLVGFSLNVFFLSIAASNQDGINWWGICQVTSHQWSELWKAVGVMVLGQFVMSFIVPLDQYMAAQLGSGSIATLGYANRLLGMGLSIGAMAIARGAMPVLANATAQGQMSHACSIARKWSFMMFFIGIVIVILAWFVTPLAVRLMFERGAFTAADSAAVTMCLRWGLFQMPSCFAGLVLVQLFASCRQYHFMAMVACGNFFIKAAMNILLTPYFGLAGMMMATALMYLFSFLCFWLHLKKLGSMTPTAK